MIRILAIVLLIAVGSMSHAAGDNPIKIASFRADITPPLGAHLGFGWYGQAKEIVDPLEARGVVLLTGEKPIVLCALDWILLNNGGHDQFREALAEAAGTTRDRVAVHCLHPHDTPGVDFTVEELLAKQGIGGTMFNVEAAQKAMRDTARAVRESLPKARAVTHVGIGQAKVEQVASNRRIIGPDGKSKAVRWSATRDPAVRAEPEGLIDPFVRVVSFWDDEKPLAAISYYATHPQSHYGKGAVSCDFPGLARGQRDAALPEVAHIHFNGAGGNITAGKYNDGSPSNRPVLAGRLALGMKKAWESTSKVPLSAKDVEWRVQPVAVPPYKSANVERLERGLADTKSSALSRMNGAMHLAWITRCQAGHKIELSCLRLGSIYVLHMPGELFVEYQLAAQKMKPEATVCMAAYGDGGPGYIGTKIAYEEGGYEPKASKVSPDVEEVLMAGMKALLK